MLNIISTEINQLPHFIQYPGKRITHTLVCKAIAPKHSCNRLKGMPLRGHRDQKKQELQTKVKDLKQKQDNWLKERQEILKSDSKLESHTDSIKNWLGHYSKEKYENKTTLSTSKFSAWTSSGADILPEDQIRLPLTPSSVGSGRLSEANDWGERHDITKPWENSKDPSIDQLADNIVQRVKAQLGRSHTPSALNEKNVNRYTQQSQTNKQKTVDPQDDTETAYLASHYCPYCSELMNDDNGPMLIVPCGHNICRRCCYGVQTCPVCQCHIANTTCNIMLKQIISDFKSNRQRALTSTTASAAGKLKDQTDANNKDKLRTLMMRMELLEQHADELQENMAAILQEVKVEQETISDIEQEEERVRREIKILEKQLEDLGTHKQEYYDRCEEIKDRHSKENEKLQLVRTTIKDLNREVEKIQLLCKDC